MSIDRAARHVLRFARDEAGVTAVVVGLLLVVLIGFAALGVDVASLYADQRGLQAKADLAAVSGAGHVPDAAAAVDATVAGNGLPPSALTALDYGTYQPDPAIAIGSRVTASVQSDPKTNAVAVTLQQSSPLYFARVLTGRSSITLSASATATRPAWAAFSLGSRLAQLNAGVLNGLLTAALGTSVSLSLADYQSLASTNVNLLSFSQALGTRAGLTLDDFQNLESGQVTYNQVVGALLDVAGAGSASAPLTTLVNMTGAATLGASDLIEPEGDALLTQAGDVLPQVNVSALDILAAAADVVTRDRQVTLSLDGTLPGGVGGVSTDLLVGEPAVQSGRVTLGSPGATIHTAQTRLLVNVGLSPSLLSLAGATVASVQLPLYMELASATATLSSVNCAASQPGDTAASFATGVDGVDGTHVADLYIGSFDSSVFTNTGAPLTVDQLGYADLLTLSVLGISVTIQGKSFVAVGESTSGTTSFTVTDMQNGTVKTVTSGDLLSSSIGTLLGDLSLRISPTTPVGALVGAVVNPLLSSLPTTMVGSLAGTLDTAIDALMQDLGLGVGQADLKLYATGCGPVRLVR